MARLDVAHDLIDFGERAAEDDSRKRLGQEMSRLQSTLEYLLLKGDMTAAQRLLRDPSVTFHSPKITTAWARRPG